MRVFLNKHKALRILLNVLVFVLVLLSVRAYLQKDTVAGLAPAISGQLLNGKEVSLAQYRGEPLLLHFWASWCGICRLEEDGIDALSKDYPVLSVAMQSGSGEEVSAYMQKQGLEFPVLNDPGGDIASGYGVSGVPASFILDGQGAIRFVEVGYTTSLGLRLRLWLARWI